MKKIQKNIPIQSLLSAFNIKGWSRHFCAHHSCTNIGKPMLPGHKCTIDGQNKALPILLGLILFCGFTTACSTTSLIPPPVEAYVNPYHPSSENQNSAIQSPTIQFEEELYQELYTIEDATPITSTEEQRSPAATGEHRENINDFAAGIEETSRTITINEAIDLALSDNLDLMLARAEEAVARMRTRVEAGALFPELDFGVMLRRQTGQTKSDTSGVLNKSVEFNLFENQLGLAYRLNIGEQVQSILTTAKELDQSIWQTLDVKQRLLLRTNELYQNLLSAKIGVQISNQLVQDSMEFVDIAEARELSGIGLGSEVARAKAKLASDQRQKVEAEKNWKTASVSLSVVLRLKSDGLLDPAEAQLSPESYFSVSDINSAVENARQRPDIQAAKQAVEAAEYRTSAAKWDLFGPDVVLDINENILGDSINNIRDRTEYGAFIAWNVSLDKFRRIRQRKAEEYQAQLRVIQTEERTVGEVNSAYKEILASQEQIPLALEELEAAQANLRISLARFRAGTAIALEVLDAEDTLAQARLNLAISIIQNNLAQIRLLAAAGFLSEDTFLQ